MKKICISASLKFKDLIRETIQRFDDIGIKAMFPNLDSGLNKDELTQEIMGKLITEHFQAIDESEALYVLNPGGYIGTLVTAEIGYALGKGKPVCFSEGTNSIDLDFLSQDVISIDEIEKFLDL